MDIGVRVVRGPDWKWGNQDGGEGFVGTVVEVGKKGSNVSPKKTVIVQWDNGTRTNYRMGYHGMYDLSIYDNATVGVQHLNIICNSCAVHITGMRYKCLECEDFDLCASCYHADKHFLSHQFMLFVNQTSVGIRIPKREGSRKVVAKGLFPGAKVVRGPDWDWGNQDGGEGKVGKLLDIRGWDNESFRSVASVQWASGGTNVYRVGHKGKVDVMFVEAASGGYYYMAHLCKLGDDIQTSSSTSETRDKKVFIQGDKVKVELDVEVLKPMQEGHGGWNPKMEECIKKVGYVHRITEKGDVRVQYQDGIRWTFHPGTLTKVKTFSVGDFVRITTDMEKLKSLQPGHGEWTEGMKMTLGKTGKILKVYSDGDLRVSVDSKIWTYHADCVTAVETDVQDVNRTVVVPTQTQQDPSGNVQRLMERFSNFKTGDDSMEKFVTEAARGNKKAVIDAIKKHPQWVDATSSGKSALHVSAHQGHLDIVRLLVQCKANLSLQDQDGDTALHYAVFGNQPEITQLLVTEGANLDLVNKGKCSCLHVAVNKGYIECVKILINHRCNVNLQDCYGDTALHDAIAKDNRGVIDLLMAASGADFTLPNIRGFNALQHSALKGNRYATEKFVTKARQLVNRKKDDGFSALHLAALNGHKEVAYVLITTGQCEINIQNSRLQTPLHLAVSQGHPEVIELLLSEGADIHAADEDGNTSLHLSLMRQTIIPGGEASVLIRQVQSKLPEGLSVRSGVLIACYLIQEGANPSTKNRSGKIPMELTMDKKSETALKHFIQIRLQEYHKKKRKGTKTAGLLGGGEGDIVAGTVEADGAGSSSTSAANLVSEEKMVNVKCKMCNNNSNCRFEPCGHIGCCMDCAEFFSMCFLCKAEIKDKVQVNKDYSVCSVCKGNPADTMLLPCGHRLTCTDCSLRLNSCPTCSQPVAELLTKESQLMNVLESSDQPSVPKQSDGARVKSPHSSKSGQEDLEALREKLQCVICMENDREVIFLCGHSTCKKCSRPLKSCPMCRKPIMKKIEMYR